MPREPDPARDPAYLEDMLQAALAVKAFVVGRTREDYANNLLFRSAVERQVEIIGEAARRVSQQTKNDNSQVPWAPIQAQRHRIVHEYGELNDDLIWKVATIHVPALIDQIRQILPPDGSPPEAACVLDRMVNAVEQVRRRLLRVSSALQSAGVDYAVVGGNAVAAWVATIDQAAVRNTQDVDIMIRREDFTAARSALESAGFIYRHAAGLDIFLDSPDSSPRNAVHLIFANETVKPGQSANPDVTESIDMPEFRVLNLDALVRIKLTVFRDKDRTHLRDFIGVGLVDQSWTERLAPALATRLQQLLDTPDG